MQDLLCEQDEHVVTGFINSHGELEFTIYKQIDGGCLTLENKKYDEAVLLDLLSMELNNYITNNK